ncbi:MULTISPECIES: cupin domain-containing protein [Pseudomonas]|jgi:transcriptional regulator with XRE-family HTH domain|uniref:Cupin domain-containing protein n=1 Tax=Pseudomonas chlororaphis subsp. aurantiaca TaxID=86192 RepID=A0AAJ0ZPN9_9PSED|nr:MULTISPECIES: cupin domain-containing protein [Pseudomonas]AIC18027.1 DNA-binding protein [Pseudomonas chlororaphis]AIS14985.1 DNA-binding protein [Pseudomonas chlororaphis subsp. aurantiaca]AVO57209.1 cupin domain-containing protein [Pseudomonas chlororaphis subsp. piscium]AZC48513.1 Transcriptional regulator [Pseudomonas chlororaphis subsp. piscium]AZC55080.1 Transcriptional regulator [Pseudomonas chlororaphis subsp. piscium]
MTADRIGERLRRYRRAAKKTLRQIASESGLTASFLSQAERNLTGVSISSLVNIAKSLNVPLNALFDQPTQAQPDSHDGKRVRYTIEGQPLSYERLSSSFPGNLINAVKMNIPVGYQSELISHDGAEFSYVLAGQIVYTIEGQQYPLGAGDSVHFDSTKPHYLANAGNDPAEVLTVTTMGLFDDHSAA